MKYLTFFRFVLDFKMEEIDVVSAKANVTYFISLALKALKKELSWNALTLIFDGITLSNGQYKAVIKSLLKELEQLQQQLQSRDNQTSENEYSSEIPLPEIGNPEMEIDAKYKDIQDLSMDEDPASDTENYEDKLSDENNLEVFQEKVKIPETNLDLLASRFYEFIGNKDEIAKEENG